MSDINMGAQEIFVKYERESQFRVKVGRWTWVDCFIGISLIIFYLYVVYFRTLSYQKQGAIHLGTALGIIFLLFPIKKGLHRKQKTVPWYDVVLAFTAMYVAYHKVIFFDSILQSRVT